VERYINLQDRFGYTPLHFAVEASDAVLARVLSFGNIVVNKCNRNDNQPLHYFCEKNQSKNMHIYLQTMLDRGAEVSARNDMAETPLHKCVLNRHQIIETNTEPSPPVADDETSTTTSDSSLLASVDNIRRRASLSNTITSQRARIMSMLLQHGADVHAVNESGESVLHYACYMNGVELVLPLLRAGANPLLKSSDGRSPVAVATNDGNKQLLKCFSVHERRLADAFAFSPFRDSVLDEIPKQTWWHIAKYVGAQYLISLCKHLEVMLRPKVTFVRIKEKCDNESLQVLLSAPRMRVAFPNLTRLEIYAFDTMADRHMVGLDSVRALKAFSCAGACGVTNVGLRRLVRLNKLHSIDVSYCPLVDDLAMLELSRVTSLRQLALGGNKLVTAEGIRHISELPRLTSLDLRFSNFNDNAFSSLSKSPVLVTNLQRLVLRGCRQLTARGLTRVSRLAALKHLDLCATQAGADLLLAAAKLRRLESLDVSYCESITRDAVNELIERAGSLRTLLLHNCSQLNEADVDEMQMLANLLNDSGGVHLEALFLTASDKLVD